MPDKSRGMKRRIAIWAGAGALVVIFWTLYISSAAPAAGAMVWTLAGVTCPISLARHHSLSFNLVLVANAATYAFLGTVVEAMRSHFERTRMAPRDCN